MLLSIYNLKLLICIIMSAIVIKVIDNAIDYNDGYVDEGRLISERGILPYIVILISIACILNTSVTVSIIFSAYVIGMFEDLKRQLTFKLKGYQESIIILIIGILFLGIKEMGSSLSIILAIQFIDDFIDIKKDKLLGNKNYVLKFGKIEIFIFTLILILISIKLSLVKAVTSFVVFFVFQYLEKFVSWGNPNEYSD
ncbi:putative membrane protein [Gottschalkia purinilytica]|uniref:Putative membrane protein n=1 Tax=Gottschalkia purinilytica TaxID=1503 RepID=A0A0L0WBU1_GOTPU|nr:hypothetical protein [Gottschalkia purinilytica]KNF08917.1 putative membrane protein [Gottschalkia purinilytica]